MKRVSSTVCVLFAALAFAVNAREVVLDGTWTIVPLSGPDVCRGVATGLGKAADVFADVLEEATGGRPKVVTADKMLVVIGHAVADEQPSAVLILTELINESVRKKTLCVSDCYAAGRIEHIKNSRS